MKTQKYQLENPNNARIFVDYNNKDNPVRFEYVGNESQYHIVKDFFYKTFIGTFVFVVFFALVSLLIASLITDNQFHQAMIGMSIYLFCIIILPYILAFFLKNNKKFIHILPELQLRFSKVQYEIDIKPEDIKDNKFEIPLFSNIGLKYYTEEEFAIYLDRIEIVEHPFNMYVAKNWFSRIIKKRNAYCWKCTFYFSQPPKSGFLKCRFR